MLDQGRLFGLDDLVAYLLRARSLMAFAGINDQYELNGYRFRGEAL